MIYALIQLPLDPNKRKIIVATCYIENFDKYNSSTKSQVYKYDDGEHKYKCVILHVSNLIEDLQDPELRVRVPTITNRSALESSSDEDADLTKLKKCRKDRKQSSTLSKKQKVKEILDAYKAANVISKTVITSSSSEISGNGDGNKNEDSSNDSTEERAGSNINEGQNLLSKKKTSRVEIDRSKADSICVSSEEGIFVDLSDGEDKENVGDESSNNSSKIIRNKNKMEEENMSSSKQVIGTDFNAGPGTNKSEDLGSAHTAENRRTKNYIVSQQKVVLKDNVNQIQEQDFERLLQLEQLKQKQLNSKQKELRREELEQQEREQELERQEREKVLERQRQQARARQQHQLAEVQQEQRTQKNNYHYLQNDTFVLGDNIVISSASFRNAKSAATPARFITCMAHTIWPLTELAVKVVRKQKNTGERKLLTPRKVELLSYHFEDYLIKHFTEERTQIELKKINVYLGRAITSAKRKLILKDLQSTNEKDRFII